MKKLLLVLFLPLLSFSIVPKGNYKTCLNSSNKLESPSERDSQKIYCFNRSPEKKSTHSCLQLARILEHTTAADSLVFSCISNNIFKISGAECIHTAKKLNYSETRDRALWLCIENHQIKKSKCKDFSDEMTYPHNKAVAFNYCMQKP